MRALQLVEWKHPPEFREVPEPEPGPGEVVLRIAGSGACHSDLHLMHDFEAGLLPWGPPFTLGHENAGWVDAARSRGHGARDRRAGVGARAVGVRCLLALSRWAWRTTARTRPRSARPAAGSGSMGGWRRRCSSRTPRHLVPLGDLDPIDAAPLSDAGLTPYHAIKRSLHLLGPGSVAVVIGVGGLGHMAVQMLAALTPTTIVAVDERETALEAALRAGAAHRVTAGGSPASVGDVIREVTGGRGADVVLDFVGVDSSLALGALVVRSLGHLTIVGIGGGTLPVSFFSIAYEASVATTYWGSVTELMEVVALAQTGRIAPQVHRFSLDDAMKAYDAMEHGELDGRAVIVPS